MTPLTTLVILIFGTLLCCPCVAADRVTVFKKSSGGTTVPEVISQRRIQEISILKSIDAIDQGSVLPGFGFPENGIRMALIDLDPARANPTRVYIALVLRNDSSQGLTFHGHDSRVIKISGFDEMGQPLARTVLGNSSYGGPNTAAVSISVSQTVLPPGAQVVYEINLATLFVIPPNKSATFSGSAILMQSRDIPRIEVRSPSVSIVPKTADASRSIYDPPIVPEWVEARVKAYVATNGIVQRSNAAARAAQTMAKPTNFVFFSSLPNVTPTNPFVRPPQKDMPPVSAPSPAQMDDGVFWGSVTNNVKLGLVPSLDSDKVMLYFGTEELYSMAKVFIARNTRCVTLHLKRIKERQPGSKMKSVVLGEWNASIIGVKVLRSFYRSRPKFEKHLFDRPFQSGLLVLSDYFKPLERGSYELEVQVTVYLQDSDGKYSPLRLPPARTKLNVMEDIR